MTAIDESGHYLGWLIGWLNDKGLAPKCTNPLFHMASPGGNDRWPLIRRDVSLPTNLAGSPANIGI